MATTAATEASQLGIASGPMRARAMKLIASLMSEKITMAVTSEISRNRACTSRNSTTAKAMMMRATSCTRCGSRGERRDRGRSGRSVWRGGSLINWGSRGLLH